MKTKTDFITFDIKDTNNLLFNIKQVILDLLLFTVKLCIVFLFASIFIFNLQISITTDNYKTPVIIKADIVQVASGTLDLLKTYYFER